MPRHSGVFAMLLVLAARSPMGHACSRQPIDTPPIAAAWRTLRVVDCARCHGRDHDGHAAPSIIDYVRTQGRDRFVRIVLDGDVPRGMPAYRTNSVVSRQIDALYAYFSARAHGDIGPRARPSKGTPCPAAKRTRTPRG